MLSGNLTFGELYKGLDKIRTAEEAKRYLEERVEWAMHEHGQTEAEAREIQLSNIGYISGYFKKETSLRIRKLFDAKHPIFGDTYPEPAEAYAMGKRAAEEDLQRKSGQH